MNLEQIILESFKKIEGKKVKNLDLIVAIPDSWDEEYVCEIMEKKDNGKVWTVECTSTGKVKIVYQV